MDEGNNEYLGCAVVFASCPLRWPRSVGCLHWGPGPGDSPALVSPTHVAAVPGASWIGNSHWLPMVCRLEIHGALNAAKTLQDLGQIYFAHSSSTYLLHIRMSNVIEWQITLWSLGWSTSVRNRTICSLIMTRNRPTPCCWQVPSLGCQSRWHGMRQARGWCR